MRKNDAVCTNENLHTITYNIDKNESGNNSDSHDIGLGRSKWRMMSGTIDLSISFCIIRINSMIVSLMLVYVNDGVRETTTNNVFRILFGQILYRKFMVLLYFGTKIIELFYLHSIIFSAFMLLIFRCVFMVLLNLFIFVLNNVMVHWHVLFFILIIVYAGYILSAALMEIFAMSVGIPNLTMVDQLFQMSVISICVFVLILCGIHSVIIALIIFMCVNTSMALSLGDCKIIDITFIVISAGRLPLGVGNMYRYIIRADNTITIEFISVIVCTIVFSIIVSPVLTDRLPFFVLF